jgi:LacI family transcriptional regulator
MFPPYLSHKESSIYANDTGITAQKILLLHSLSPCSMKYEAITIKDIAKALGLSTSTVSRALRDSYEISPETKERVLIYAKENNYRPNPIALSLKEKRSSSIGVLVSEISNRFFSQAIDGIESVAQEKGYNVIIAQSKENFEREVSALHYLASRSVDGIIVSVSAGTSDFSTINDLYLRGMPMVSFDRVVDHLNMHKVVVDNYKGAYEATAHLIQNGYKKIACVAGSAFLSISQERVAGYKNALQDHNMKIEEDLIKYCAHSGLILEEVEDIMNELTTQKKKPDAIIACSDKITTNIMRHCQQQNISIPKEVALLGFSNIELTELLTPSLSIVQQPAAEMGRIAAELLIKSIESKKPTTEFEHVILPTELFQRASSAKK